MLTLIITQKQILDAVENIVVPGGGKLATQLPDHRLYPLPPEFLIKISERQAKELAAATLGKFGGSKKSDKKTETARENGKKGGRPKKNYHFNGL